MLEVWGSRGDWRKAKRKGGAGRGVCVRFPLRKMTCRGNCGREKGPPTEKAL